MPLEGAFVRRATADDARGIVMVLAAVAEERRWIATEPPVDIDARTERVAAAVADGRFVAFVVERAGEIAGQLTLLVEGASARIGMALLADLRGNRLGGELLDAAIAYARSAAFERLTLEVFDDNAVARRLYASRAFVATGAISKRT